jgi:hypothetical protein
MEISEKGKDLNGNILNEDNLHYDTLCLFRGKLYKTGNRKNDAVELFIGREFIRVVKMKNICVCT